MKKITLTVFIFLLLFTLQGSHVFAETITQTRMYPLIGGTGSTSAGTKPGLAIKETNLRARADAEIQRRITALNELLTKINNLKHVPEANKAAYTTQIQTEIANLNTLQAKIDADTDATTLKTDVQSIVTSYRVFALFMPQLRILAAADSVTDITDKLTSLAARLQTRLTEAQSAGKDATSLQALLTDMQAKIADANTQAAAVIAEVLPLTPAGFPENKTILQDARKKLVSIHESLKTAGQDAKQIIQGLKAFTRGKENATDSAKMDSNSRFEKNPMKIVNPPLRNTSSEKEATGGTTN